MNVRSIAKMLINFKLYVQCTAAMVSYCIHYLYNSVKLKTAAVASGVFWCIKPGVANPILRKHKICIRIPMEKIPDPDLTLIFFLLLFSLKLNLWHICCIVPIVLDPDRHLDPKIQSIEKNPDPDPNFKKIRLWIRIRPLKKTGPWQKL